MVETPVSLSEELLPAERRQQLIQWFQTNVSGTNQELARMFNISVSTVRRDLDSLAAEGIVRRTHGGAVRIRSRTNFEPSTDLARRTAVEEKNSIVRHTLQMIEPKQSIIIDSGAVIAHMLAEELSVQSIPLTVITNDLYVATTLAYKEHIKLIVPGGSCRFGSYGLLGQPGLDFLVDIRCDCFFMSAQALDLECASETLLDVMLMKRAMIEAAERTVLMLDSSRFFDRALYRTVPTEAFDTIITDEGLSEEAIDKLRLRGINLEIAKL
ncbi:DeoR/GlpR family DNA-binding transcription regulator [uncultured Cohaesibacter sp.]|uniref:DeoR/GlpR family DNA-binding transcription regulator n=1 Tax=uncultured Cohaesibacter sp. TaxID=1002546 RepID=UPI002AABD61D|nr:DeoR/GlpR family DNA-binding transcription regulator [uncultured Cohaesibacter sp.]